LNSKNNGIQDSNILPSARTFTRKERLSDKVFKMPALFQNRDASSEEGATKDGLRPNSRQQQRNSMSHPESCCNNQLLRGAGCLPEGRLLTLQKRPIAIGIQFILPRLPKKLV
jgi:hypothetical protein